MTEVVNMDLRFLHWCIVSVTHGADLHGSLAFLISLPVELVHDAFSPLAVQVKGFGWVAQVSTMHQILENLWGKKTTKKTNFAESEKMIKMMVVAKFYMIGWQGGEKMKKKLRSAVAQDNYSYYLHPNTTDKSSCKRFPQEQHLVHKQ